jgi:hypothetical protein
LTAKAATGDGSPYDTIGELSSTYGLTDGPFLENKHPRTPGALALQTPLVLGGPDTALTIMDTVVILSVVFVLWAATVVAGLPWWGVLAGVGLWWYQPVRDALVVGSQGPFVAALIAATWLSVVKSDRGWGGVGLGVATTLKLFPGFLIVVLWLQGKRRTAYGAAATFAGLNVAGVALGVPFDLTVFGSSEAANPYNLASTTGFLVGLVLAAYLFTQLKRMDVSQGLAAGTGVMLLLTPVLWSHYLLILLVPVVVVMRGTVGAFRTVKSPSSGYPSNPERTPSLHTL